MVNGMPTPLGPSDAAANRTRTRVLGYTALAGVAVLLSLGATLPLFTVDHFYFFHNTYSLIGATVELFNEGEIYLFVLVVVFSMLLPVYKLFVMFKLIGIVRGPVTDQKVRRYRKFLTTTGKWSMLDVFVVALFIVVVRASAVTEIKINIGMYFFSAGVIGSMLLFEWVLKGSFGPSNKI